MPRFTGQVILVTGGSAGLGAGIAARLAAEGATVIVNGRDAGAVDRTVAVLRAAGGVAEGWSADVTDESVVGTGLEGLLRRHGGLDGLVHSAGMVGVTRKNILQYPDEEFDRVVRTNLTGSFLVARACLPPMARRGRGRALFLASMAGRDGNPDMMGYTAAKAGVFGLVKALGREFAGTGVTVNGLAPAVVRTALVDAMDPAHVDYLTRLIPMRRTGTIAEVAALAAWILGPECSYTTGFIFDASGGRATY